MSEKLKTAAKTPETKSANAVSRKPETASSASVNSPVEQILSLQRTIGNQRVQRLLKSGTLQTKLKIGQPGDKYNQESVHVAKHVETAAKNIKRSPDTPEAEKIPSFKLAEVYDIFNNSLIYTLSRFYIGRDEVHVKQVEDFDYIDDRVHPAYYNPNDRTVYFSQSGFEFIYNDRVLDKKSWSEEDYKRFVIETAIEEAFHVYQDTPRHRSKKFAGFETGITKKIIKEFEDEEYIETGVMDTHEKFRKYIPYFTNKYLPEKKIKEFMGENLPGMHRHRGWQLSAKEEILNQWMHILDSCYFRARAKLRGKPGLKEEERHKVSLIEKQASKVAKMKTSEVQLWLLTYELKKEADPKKEKELRRKIKKLKAEVDLKNISMLEKRRKELESEFIKLGYSEKDLKRSEEIAKELIDIENRLDYLISLRDGLEAVFKKKEGLLIPK